MNTTRALIHNAQIDGCGGVFVGDWNEVECAKCGLRLNTLDVPSDVNGKLADDEVLRLSEQNVLVAVTVAFA